MAHGGHSGGARIHSHTHYHRSSWNGGFDSDNIGAILLMSTFLIVIIVAVIFKFLSSDNIGDKKPLEDNYKVVQYLLSQVKNSRDGKYWKTKICEFADKLIS